MARGKKPDGTCDSSPVNYSEGLTKTAPNALIRLVNTVQLTDFKIIIDEAC